MLRPVLYNDANDMLDVFDPVDTWEKMWNGFMGAPLAAEHAMRTDVVDEGKDYKLTCDLPGFNKEDITADVKNGILTISASHKENKDEKDEKTGKYLRRERSMASYRRSFNVGGDVKPEDVTAKYENGVLTVTVPKKETAVEGKADNAKRIEVQ